LIATHIEIDDFGQESTNDKNEQDPEKPLLELVDRSSLANGSNDSSTKTLGRNNAQAANETANGEIDKHALVAVAGTSPKSSKGTAYNDHSSVRQEPWCDDKMLHLLDIGGGRLFRSI